MFRGVERFHVSLAERVASIVTVIEMVGPEESG